jgi:hypothetical protein
MRRWHLVPLALVAIVLIALPALALTDTGLEHDVRKALGISTGECEPETNLASAWVSGPSLPSDLDEPRGTALGDDVYLVGGITGVEEVEDGRLLLEPSDELTRFNPRTGEFTELAPLPEPLNHVGVFAHDDDLYVLGGYGRSRDEYTSSAFWRYDPDSDRWSRLPPMPAPRAAMAVGVVGRRLIVAGGALDSVARPQAFAYDFESGRWSHLPPMLSSREHVGAAVVGDRLYVLGGRNSDSLALDTAERYDVSARRWERLPPMLVGSGGLGVVALGGHVVTVGGGNDGAGTVTGAVQEFDPQTSEWSFLPEMRTPRHGQATAAVGDRIWVFGGSPCAYFNATDSVEALDLRDSGL